jgi:hypothetical protein
VAKYAWCVKVGDGSVCYFEDKPEAEDFHRAAAERALEATLVPIPLPMSVAEFVHFLERQEAERRVAEASLAEIQRLIPNWREFPSLPAAVERAIGDGGR